jgi:protein-S-isoprenylcysteine O-methyltransferase Ste14
MLTHADSSKRTRHLLVSVGGGILWSAIAGAVMFGAAGRLNVLGIWVLLVIMAVLGTITVATLRSGEFRERHAHGPGDVGKATTAMLRLSVLATLIVGALDAGRFHWSRPAPWALELLGMTCFAAGLAFAFWAVAVNRHYTHEIRVQVERNHSVIERGPYRYIRHPSYIGLMVVLPAAAMALGSWWALLPALASWAVLIRRTAVEDRLLLSQLPGYADYAARVKYRLVPALW